MLNKRSRRTVFENRKGLQMECGEGLEKSDFIREKGSGGCETYAGGAQGAGEYCDRIFGM